MTTDRQKEKNGNGTGTTSQAETIKDRVRRLGYHVLTPAERAVVDQEQAERKAAIERAERLSHLTRTLGERYSPDQATLDRYEVYTDGQRQVLDRLRAMIPSLAKMAADGRGGIFFGSVGTGKDHLMAAMLYETARAGPSCAWLAGAALYDKERGMERVLSRHERVEVLGISDPATPGLPLATWHLATVLATVDARYRARQATWITVNAKSPDEIREMLTTPLFDRLREGAEMFRCLWPSYRERVNPK